MDGHRQMDWVQRSVQPVIEGCIMKTLYILKVLRILVFIYKVASMSSLVLIPPKERFMLHVTLFFFIVLELRMI